MMPCELEKNSTVNMKQLFPWLWTLKPSCSRSLPVCLLVFLPSLHSLSDCGVPEERNHDLFQLARLPLVYTVNIPSTATLPSGTCPVLLSLLYSLVCLHGFNSVLSKDTSACTRLHTVRWLYCMDHSRLQVSNDAHNWKACWFVYIKRQRPPYVSPRTRQ